MSLNLHAITRGIITAVHPDEQISVCVCSGEGVDDRGIVTPIYENPVAIVAQVQHYHDGEQRKNGINFNEESIRVFAYVDPVLMSALSRPEKVGDMVQRADGTWWRVVDVDNDFAKVGWLSAICVKQVNPPEGVQVSNV